MRCTKIGGIMKKKILTIIRLILTILLLIGIYKETGICTVIFAVLVSVALEIFSSTFKKIAELIIYNFEKKK